MKRRFHLVAADRLKRFIHPRRYSIVRGLVRSEFVRHGMLVFGSSMFLNGAGYVFHLILSRRLGVAGYGDLLALMSLLLICSAFGTIANMVVVKFAAEFYAVGNQQHLADLGGSLVRRSLTAIAVVALLGVPLTPLLGTYLHIDDAPALIWLFVALGLATVLPPARGLLQGAHRFGALSVSLSIDAFGKIVLGAGLAIAGFGVAGAVCGIALTSIAAFVYTVFAARAGLPKARAPIKLDGRRLLQTVGGVSGATIGMALLSSSDVVLVKHYFSAHDAGLYGVASMIGKMLLFVVGFVPTLVLPKATATAATGRSAARVLWLAGGFTVAISTAGLAILAAVPQLVVRGFGGSAFLEASHYVVAYGAAMSLLAATGLAVAFRVGVHRFGFVVPMCAVALLEIAAISLYHPALTAVIAIVIGANALALVALVVGILPERAALIRTAPAAITS